MIMLLVFLFLLVFGLSIIQIVAQWKVYVKAGEPGWASIVPIYNFYVLLRIAGKPWWWMLMMVIPGVNIVFAIWLINMISKSFGKDEGFTAGLLLLGVVFWPILGFSRNIQYQGPYGDPIAREAFRRRTQGFEFENQQPGF